MASHIKEMLGYYPARWWRLCWLIISPLLIFGILIFSFIRYRPVEYNSTTYPVWADILGWCLTLASNIPIVVVAAYVFYQAAGDTVSQKLRSACHSTSTTADFKKNLTSLSIIEAGLHPLCLVPELHCYLKPIIVLNYGPPCSSGEHAYDIHQARNSSNDDVVDTDFIDDTKI